MAESEFSFVPKKGGRKGSKTGPPTTHVVFTQGGLKDGNKDRPDGNAYEAVQFIREMGYDPEQTLAPVIKKAANALAKQKGMKDVHFD